MSAIYHVAVAGGDVLEPILYFGEDRPSLTTYSHLYLPIGIYRLTYDEAEEFEEFYDALNKEDYHTLVDMADGVELLMSEGDFTCPLGLS